MTLFRRFGQPWSERSPYVVNHAHISVVTPPAVEPINIVDVRKFIRVNFTTDDQIIETLMKSARDWMERYLRRALITQTIRLDLDWGPAWVELPRPPLQSVVSVECVGLNGAIFTADPASYYVIPEARLIGLQPSSVWPVHITPAGWRCTFIAGYGDTPDTIPSQIISSMWNIVAAMYDNRGDLSSAIDMTREVLRRRRRSLGS